MTISPYATIAQFEQFAQGEAVQLSNLGTPQAGRSRQEVLSASLTQATGEIDSWLGRHITQDSPMLVQFCCVIARKILDLNEFRDKVIQDYKDAIKQLQAIRAGAATLLDANGNPIPIALPPGGTGGSYSSVTGVGDRTAGTTQIRFG